MAPWAAMPGQCSLATIARRFTRAAWLCIALALVGMGPPAAAESTTAPSEPNADWAPPIEDTSGHDWIKFDTGELLKGEVMLIHDQTVDFTSMRLDEFELELDHIVEMQMSQAHTFVFTGRRVVVGVGGMRGDVIRIRVGDHVQQFERKDFVGMIRGTGRELDYWSLKASFGLSGQQGNTNQLSINGGLTLRRETALTRGTLSYTGNVATQDDALSANNHRASVAFNVYLTKRLYLVVPSVEAFQDEFQNIALRLTPALGVGYKIISAKRVQWEAEFATGYQSTRYISVASGSNVDGDVALQFGSSLDIDLPKRFEWTSSYQPQVIVTDIGKTSQHFTSTLSFDFWGPLDFDTTFQWDWVASPVADSDGQIPESSDFRIIVGIALDL